MLLRAWNVHLRNMAKAQGFKSFRLKLAPSQGKIMRLYVRHLAYLAAFMLCSLSSAGHAADWPRFRGADGSGVSTDSKPIPTEWSDTKNLLWKVDLPGPGHSCPIVVGDRVFVTCWSGYGMTRDETGDQSQLKRHLICVDRKSGKVLWDKAIPAALPEDAYRGMFAEHGYASHTPASDGKSVFVFFGKSGVYAFDLDGNEKWHKQVGTDSDRRGWGTASSVVLYKDLVIVTAAIESRTIFAFKKDTGEEVWRQEAEGLDSTWGTPILVDLPEGRTDLVLAVPFEVWGLNPETGKLRWYCETADSDSYCSSAIAHDDVVYVVESRGSGGAMAIRAGGKGDVSATNVLWSSNDRGRISSPVYFDGRLYFISGKIVRCLDAKTGERIYQSRLTSDGSSTAEPIEDDAPGPRRGGRGGRMGGQDYSSPVVAGNRMIFVTRAGEMHVVELGKEFRPLAVNRFDNDRSDYSASPAVSDGQLFIRSAKALYCVGERL